MHYSINDMTISYTAAEEIQNEKKLDSPDDFYIIAESICCIRKPKFQKKFVDALKSLDRDRIIQRCEKIIRLHTE